MKGIRQFPEIGLPTYLALRGDLSDPGETLLKLRALQSFDRGAARYAIHRTVRCAVRRPLDEVFDALALDSDLVAQRMDSTSLLLDGPGVFISVEGSRKIDYGSCTFNIWADSMNRPDQVRAKMLAIVGEQLVRRARNSSKRRHGTKAKGHALEWNSSPKSNDVWTLRLSGPRSARRFTR